MRYFALPYLTPRLSAVQYQWWPQPQALHGDERDSRSLNHLLQLREAELAFVFEDVRHPLLAATTYARCMTPIRCLPLLT